MAGGTLASMHNGERLVIIGLFVQIIFFGFFIIVSILFHNRIHNGPTHASQSLKASSLSLKTSWEGLLYALYASSTAILIRSIFRVVEYIQGNDGYLLRNEVWLYLFDAVLMFAVMMIFNFVHPSEVIPTKKGKRTNAEGHMAMDDSVHNLRV